MTVENLKKATPLIENLAIIDKDLAHLQELAYILSYKDCKLEFKLKIEHEKEYDNKVEAEKALKIIDSDEIDSYIKGHLNKMNESLQGMKPINVIDLKKEERTRHELSGEISDVVGLETLGVLLSNKLSQKEEIKEKLRIIGLKID